MAYIDVSSLKKSGFNVSVSKGVITVSKNGRVVSRVPSGGTQSVTASGGGVVVSNQPRYNKAVGGYESKVMVSTPTTPPKAVSNLPKDYLKRRVYEQIIRERSRPTDVYSTETDRLVSVSKPTIRKLNLGYEDVERQQSVFAPNVSASDIARIETRRAVSKASQKGDTRYFVKSRLGGSVALEQKPKTLVAKLGKEYKKISTDFNILLKKSGIKQAYSTLNKDISRGLFGKYGKDWVYINVNGKKVRAQIGKKGLYYSGVDVSQPVIRGAKSVVYEKPLTVLSLATIGAGVGFGGTALATKLPTTVDVIGKTLGTAYVVTKGGEIIKAPKGTRLEKLGEELVYFGAFSTGARLGSSLALSSGLKPQPSKLPELKFIKATKGKKNLLGISKQSEIVLSRRVPKQIQKIINLKTKKYDYDIGTSFEIKKGVKLRQVKVSTDGLKFVTKTKKVEPALIKTRVIPKKLTVVSLKSLGKGYKESIVVTGGKAYGTISTKKFVAKYQTGTGKEVALDVFKVTKSGGLKRYSREVLDIPRTKALLEVPKNYKPSRFKLKTPKYEIQNIDRLVSETSGRIVNLKTGKVESEVYIGSQSFAKFKGKIQPIKKPFINTGEIPTVQTARGKLVFNLKTGKAKPKISSLRVQNVELVLAKKEKLPKNVLNIANQYLGVRQPSVKALAGNYPAGGTLVIRSPSAKGKSLTLTPLKKISRAVKFEKARQVIKSVAGKSDQPLFNLQKKIQAIKITLPKLGTPKTFQKQIVESVPKISLLSKTKVGALLFGLPTVALGSQYANQYVKKSNIVNLNLASSNIVRARVDNISRVENISKISQSQFIQPISKVVQRQRQEQRQQQRQQQRQEQRQAQRITNITRLSKIIKPRIRLPLRPIRVNLFAKLRSNKSFVRRVKKVLARIPKKYRPSFTAVLLNIMGKKPKTITGIELRPIIDELVKKKKAKFRRRGRK